MVQRKNKLPIFLIPIIIILMVSTACNGAQAFTPTEEVATVETKVITSESESLDADASEEADPPLEETINQAVMEAQIEPTSEPAAAPSESLPSATPITEQTQADKVEVQVEEILPTLELSESSYEEVPSDLVVDASVGSLAPDFRLTTLDGENISLADLQGKNVLINYWATWCPPCLNELTALENLQNQFEHQDFLVVTINGIEQDNLGDVQATVQEYGITYPVLLDENETFWDSYRILFLPTSIYIDEVGIIRFIKFGEQSEAEFVDMIQQLLSDQL
jgi:peroxiredoxin